MKPNENVYIGDGAYLEFTGYSFLFKVYRPASPTDVVSIELSDAQTVVNYIMGTLKDLRSARKRMDEVSEKDPEDG